MIAAEDLRTVKERADIVAIVSEHVKLKRAGRSFVGLCPFHAENSPSFTVTPARGTFHCFGCQKHGGPIDFVMGSIQSRPIFGLRWMSTSSL